MASIIATSIDLTKIPKDKIIDGKKGKYLPITITLNDEPDQFGNNGPVVVQILFHRREGDDPSGANIRPGPVHESDRWRRK